METAIPFNGMSSLLAVQQLEVEFPAPHGRLAAVREVSFEIAPGEVLGLVGESGSGKSVTALAVMGLLPESARAAGYIRLEGRELLALPAAEMRKLRGSRLAMIFQEPMTALNPVMRIGDQIAEAVAAHSEQRLSASELRRRAIEALREVAIPEPERRWRDYPHQLSGGQRQRVMIAMAIVNRPALLVADEPRTALDVTVQAQILELLAQLRQRLGLAMLFISHDLAVVSQVAQRVAVMYGGSIVESAPVRELFLRPAHPYTHGLLASVPTLASDRRQPLRTIAGAAASASALTSGCVFEPRCEFRIAQCATAFPPLLEVSPGHWARCPVING
ncbi:MAG: ABC transporter ATP-binding protein [Candidatus Korobacteraceae bacterium]